MKGIEIKKDGTYNTLIALLAAGKENCCLVMPEVKEIRRQHVQESLFTETGESAEAAREEEERLRQQEKEAILDKLKAEKEAQKAAEEAKLAAAEAEKKRKAECEALIQEAISLKTSEKYSEALKKVKKALDMNIAEKEGVIRNIKNEIEELKNKNSMATRFTSWLNNLLDENN